MLKREAVKMKQQKELLKAIQPRTNVRGDGAFLVDMRVSSCDMRKLAYLTELAHIRQLFVQNKKVG